MEVGLPFTENRLYPFAKSVSIPLGLRATATDAEIHKIKSRFENDNINNVNKEMEDIMEIEIVKSLEDSVFLKNEVLLNRK